MTYMVLMYADPAATEAMSARERAEVFHRHEALHQDLAGTGELVDGVGLAHPRDTTTLRWPGAASPEAEAAPPAPAVGPEAPASPPDPAPAAQGPFVEAAERLTACYVIECATPRRARDIAERVLDFHVVAVEVRPIHDTFGMGDA